MILEVELTDRAVVNVGLRALKGVQIFDQKVTQFDKTIFQREALSLIEPRRVSRREVNMETQSLNKPGADFGALISLLAYPPPLSP